MKILIIFLVTITISSAQEAYQIGDQIEDFRLKNVDGEMVALSDYQDINGFIIIFTCNTCPYAVAYEDRIIALHEKFAPEGYPVIAIMPNDPDVQPGDSFDHLQDRARDKGFQFPYLIDDGQKVYPKFGATRTPEVFLVDENYILRYTGAIDDNFKDPEAVKEKWTENAIYALMENRPVDPEKTKAIGCTIKKK